jgi:putative endonuclease
MAANHYIEQESLDMEVRFDVLAILRQNGKWEANHIENAFYPFDGS